MEVFHVFEAEKLTAEGFQELSELSRKAKGDILTMTTLAGTGHPGGSMSSLDLYLTLFRYGRFDEVLPDRVVVSHGHTSPGVYAALARLGHLPVDEVVAFFRKGGSPFEGHVVKGIPFIDWSTGNLGQGLSAGCGFALSARILKEDRHIYVCMGDGEQQKGQIGEARRFAVKYGLSNITVIVDYNGLQISGRIGDVMPQNVADNYRSDGWEVIETDGHDYSQIFSALKKARELTGPVCVLAHTVMGKGVPFMEHKEKYHGSPLTEKEYGEAMAILGLENGLPFYRGLRPGRCQWQPKEAPVPMAIRTGKAFHYSDDDKVDNRTAFGKALKDLGELNIPEGTPICALDCDLASSVKTGDFAKTFPDHFFQGGIQEHNTATVAGALSATGIPTFFADFGVFGIDETYNQQRLNDINRTNLKVILTHVGLDVGPDGKTHQCIDYIGLVNNLFNFRAIVPCDPNQTDRVVRYAAVHEGNVLLGMGRNRWPVICDEKGKPCFGEGYQFEYGKMDLVREGTDGAILTYGAMVSRAVRIRDTLAREGCSLAVVNVPCVQEIDGTVMKTMAGLPYLFTYEDHNVRSGIGSLIARHLLTLRYNGHFQSFGITGYGKSGETDDVMALAGLDVDTMTMVLRDIMKK